MRARKKQLAVAMASSPDQAISMVVARLRSNPVVRVPLALAGGRVLAQSLVADRRSPAVDISAMDGYAVSTTSLKSGRVAITGDVCIGKEPAPLPPGGVSRIVTGAPIPPGADAVIKREDVAEEAVAIVIPPAVRKSLRPGACIRKAGENIEAGGGVIDVGREIDAPVAAALGAFGYRNPIVFDRVRVAILVTGDELVAPEASPTVWEVRDSNAPALLALLSSRPWLEVVPARHARDDPKALHDHIKALLDDADALVVSGGASMGDRDFVPGALADVGAEILFRGVSQRPGKPVLGAVTADGKPVLALPGNPVSVMVTARRMLMPVLARLAGLRVPPPQVVTLTEPDDQQLGMWWHRPVTLTGPGTASLVPGRGSGDVVSAARSDGFVEVPPGRAGPGPWAYYGWRL